MEIRSRSGGIPPAASHINIRSGEPFQSSLGKGMDRLMSPGPVHLRAIFGTLWKGLTVRGKLDLSGPIVGTGVVRKAWVQCDERSGERRSG